MIKRVSFFNSFTGIILQVCNLITTLILPRIILLYFGSEVNGLISSISNFLLYVSIVEASISNIVMASLYKPIIEKDDYKINKILNTCDYFYKGITIIFTLYTIILSIIYPLLFDCNFSFQYVSSLILILSIGYFIQYNFSNTLRTFLKASRKVYIVNIIQSIIVILNLILSLIIVFVYPNIHILKFISGLLYILQPILFKYETKKMIIRDKKNGIDNNLLKRRWDGLAISIASFIHNLTDIALLTIFTNLNIVSVYSVYYLVVRGLEAIMIAISNGISPSLGNIYASGDEKNLEHNFSMYEFFYSIMIIFVFTISCILITDFVSLYTGSIVDADYNQPIFGYLIVIAEALFLIKTPHLNLAYAANKFKKMRNPIYFEAIINVIISFVLVQFFGLIGVAIGTLISMLYRAIYQINFTKKIIKTRNNWSYYKKVFPFIIISSAFVYIIINFLNINITSWGLWFLYASAYSAVLIVLYIILMIILYRDDLYNIMKIFRRK